MTTAGGTVVDLQAFRGELVEVEDLARALAHLCRFAGHVRRYYSVASHSAAVADELLCRGVGPAGALVGLLHDASEAYTGDLISPIKEAGGLAGFRALEAGVQQGIWARFELEGAADQHGGVVDAVDEACYRAECRALRGGPVVARRPVDGARLTVSIRGAAPARARAEWLMRYWGLERCRGRRLAGSGAETWAAAWVSWMTKPTGPRWRAGAYRAAMGGRNG
jgi:hypothetical protein